MLEIDSKIFPLVLRSIYVRSSSCTMKDTFDPFIPNQELFARFRTQKHTVQIKSAIEDKAGTTTQSICTFLNKFDFGYSLAGPSDNEPTLVAEVKATLAIDYVVRGEIPSAESLDKWGETSALIHCWPYWREFCHTAISRMSLPMVLMPMLNVQAVMDKQKSTVRKKTAPKKS